MSSWNGGLRLADAAQVGLDPHLGRGLGVRVRHPPRAQDGYELLVDVLRRDSHRDSSRAWVLVAGVGCQSPVETAGSRWPATGLATASSSVRAWRHSLAGRTSPLVPT